MMPAVLPLHWLLALFHASSHGSTISLDGSNWTLKNPSHNISIAASVPGHVHLDLLQAGLIDDPYYGDNEYKLDWVHRSSWTYVKHDLPVRKAKELLDSYLIFDGIDTFATIVFCGVEVGKSNNQFRQYSFDISAALRKCHDVATLEVILEPATEASARAAEDSPCPLCFSIDYELPNRQYMRKQQSDFGWDWGPAFSPAGLWKSARILQLKKKDIHIQGPVIDVYRRGQLNNLPPDETQPWIVNITLDYVGKLSSSASLQVRIYDDSGSILSKGLLESIWIDNIGSFGRIGGHTVVFEEVNLWWPVGFGRQPLYNIEIQVISGKELVGTAIHKRIGFRTIFLDQRPVSVEEVGLGISPGNKWNFRVNGHEIYVKGSNIIPPDVFWTSVTRQKVKELLIDAIESKQNMIRVWGGGAYWPDWAYDIADELGIMIWADFHFSIAFYPTNDELLSNVKLEAEHQVRQINHHPSLAVWVGGNEVEFLLDRIRPYVSTEYLLIIIAQYEAIFLDILLHAVFDNTRAISYSPSSITNGYIKLDHSSSKPMIERYNQLLPGTISGNTDYYNYDASQAFNSSALPTGKFATEFGFHSMPSLQAWQEVLPDSELHFNSSTILRRNKKLNMTIETLNNPGGGNRTQASLEGMAQMCIAVSSFYPSPPSGRDSPSDFSSWIYSTQVFQADFMRNQIIFYRVGSSKPERNLGTLYWQLNDIWQGPSWAGIEYSGRWKMLQYIIKDIYSNVIVGPLYNAETGQLDVYTVSDLWEPVTGHVKLIWYEWSGKVLGSLEAKFEVTALNATKVFSLNVNKLGLDLTNAIAKICVIAHKKSDFIQGDSHQYSHTSWFHAMPIGKQALLDPKLNLSVNRRKHEFTVTSAGGISAWTWLDHPSGVSGSFEDNGFWVQPGEIKVVKFKVKEDRTNGKWMNEVTVRSIWDNRRGD